MAEADRVILAMETFGENITKDLMISMRRRLSSPPPEGTPRDTQFASSNWLLSVRRPSDRVVGSKERVSTSAGQRTERLLRAWSLMDGPIYCVNNVPYIVRLNDGYSPQTAAGFAERIYDDVASVLDRRRSP